MNVTELQYNSDDKLLQFHSSQIRMVFHDLDEPVFSALFAFGNRLFQSRIGEKRSRSPALSPTVSCSYFVTFV